MVHEIGHVVGLHHQHNRPDRDEAVHINWQNLATGSQAYFRKQSFPTLGVPYDYTSIMQYNAWVSVEAVSQEEDVLRSQAARKQHFSKSVYERSAMVTQDPRHQPLLGRSAGLSFRDRKTVCLMYGCNGEWNPFYCPPSLTRDLTPDCEGRREREREDGLSRYRLPSDRRTRQPELWVRLRSRS